jgi:ferritin-like metal-binding protein YciE
LGLSKVKKILALTLTEEKGADAKLTEVAETSINMEAAHQEA